MVLNQIAFAESGECLKFGFTSIRIIGVYFGRFFYAAYLCILKWKKTSGHQI